MTSLLGKKLKKHRDLKGYSLDKLAQISGASKSYLWELENRDTLKPSAEKLSKIAQALSVTTDFLLDDSAEPDETVVREAFFRKYSQLDSDDQRKINEIVDLWSSKKNDSSNET